MTKYEAVIILTGMQKWRRDEDYNEPGSMPFTPKEFGLAIDVAIDHLIKECDEATRKSETFMLNSDQLTELANDIAGKVIAGLSVEPQRKSNNVSDNEYLSADEVSRMLCVSKATLWRWEKDKKLIPIHLSGKMVRYRRSDVEKLMSEC